MPTHSDSQARGASAISVAALIIAIVALILGWIAYNRTGPDLMQVIETEVDAAFDELGSELQEVGDAPADEQLEE